MRIFRSPFGMMLRAIKSNQNRMSYTGFNTRPYTLAAFVISGMYAGLAGCAARRHRSAGRRRAHAVDGLGRGGADDHPRRRRHAARAGPRRRLIKYFENIFSAFNDAHPATVLRLPARRPAITRSSRIASLFVGEGWHLTLGLLFMLVVIFLPGGIMEGVRRIGPAVPAQAGGAFGAMRRRPQHSRPAE